MKAILKKLITLTLISSFAIHFSCQQNDLYDEIYRSYNPIHNFDASNTTGDRVTGAYNGVPFCYINAKGADAPNNFPKRLDDLSIGNVDIEFFISETVVTNELFRVVYQWAYDNGKFTDDVSATNTIDDLDANYGGWSLIHFSGSNTKFDMTNKVFKVESRFEKHPVVSVTGYGAVMFCNWLTEMTGGNENDMVYTGMDETSWPNLSADNSRTGYRLPTNDEWEYAARYIGKDDPNTFTSIPVGFYYWTPGRHLSGSMWSWDDMNPLARQNNYQVAVFWFYGDDGSPTGVDFLAPVGSKRPNQLGIYDMSGNVWEFCGNNNTITQLSMRGGSFRDNAEELQVGKVDSPQLLNHHTGELGFRVCKTK